MSLNSIARTVYEANRVLCAALGDRSRPYWKNAPIEHRDVIVSGVVWATEHPDATPQQAHENCLKDWAARGWKYGPVRNSESKETPAFVSWEQMSEGDRLKNELFLIVVRSMLEK